MLDPLNMGAPYASNKLRARQKSISARRSLTNQRRVMDHIHQFIRVKICVERSNSFQMLIDRHSKVEYVARQIEAEYTIRYLIRQNNQTAEATGISDLFDQSKAAVFEVSQIFDAVHFPIPFDGIIGAYVQFDDPIFVTDASDVPVDSDASKERLTNVLDNIMALQFFMEFCLQEYSVEPLLFYIEVEIFRVISDEKEAMMFAKYLYYTYVKLGAPISINLNMAVAEEIKWPITQPVSRDIYDEAQTHAYNILNGHSFVRYEKSKLHARFLKGKTAGSVKLHRSLLIYSI